MSKNADDGSSDTEGEDNLDEQSSQQQKQNQQQQQQQPEVKEESPLTTGNDDFVVVTKCDVEATKIDDVVDASGDARSNQMSLSSSRQNDGYTW